MSAYGQGPNVVERPANELRPPDLLRHAGVLYRVRRVMIAIDSVEVDAAPVDALLFERGVTEDPLAGETVWLHFAPTELIRTSRRPRPVAAALRAHPLEIVYARA